MMLRSFRYELLRLLILILSSLHMRLSHLEDASHQVHVSLAIKEAGQLNIGFAKLSSTMSLLLLSLVSCSTFYAFLIVPFITDDEAGNSEKKLDKRMEV